MSLDESVLNDVQGVVLIAKHAKCQRIRAPVIALEQRAKGIAIAFAGGFNQLAVIDWVTSGGRSLALLIHAAFGYITGTPGNNFDDTSSAGGQDEVMESRCRTASQELN